ncbi:MAG TPA: RsiV family protein [Candidatus Paceibacterota bacterium]|nr:RsiV family protein [Candidatus Paceibacterota bacterium]
MIDLNSPSARRMELIGASVLIVIVLGFTIWYMATHQAPEPYAPFPGTVEEVVETLPPEVYEEHGTYFDIEATYPAETPLKASASAEADAEAVSLMEDFVDETIADFKRQGDFDNLTPADIELMGLSDTRKESIMISYEEYAGADTVSYVYTLYVDTLGAHPNAFFRTFTFDRLSGEELKINELFVSGSDYLGRLSAIAEFELSKSLGEFADIEYIRQGVAKDAINFQSFAIDGENLVLVFPPYQVAPYAAGTQEVSIPLSQLSEILKLEYLP